MRDAKAETPLRVGLIGAGRIVERAHLPVLTAMEGVEVVGLFDPDASRATALAESFRVPNVCLTSDELFDLDLDVTLVACPNSLHARMCIAALDARTHVLCEKPMATSQAEAEAMIKAAELNNRELMIGTANRFRPEVAALQEAIKNGDLGKVKAIRCGWLRRDGVPGSWYTERAVSGGGVLTDLGSHMVDLAICITGKRRMLSATCLLDRRFDPSAQASWYMTSEAARNGLSDVEIGASGFLIFEGPAQVFIEVSWACSIPQDRTYLQVYGERGSARLETLFGFSPQGDRPEYPLQLWIDGQPVPRKVAGATDLLQPYRRQWEHLIDSIRVGRSLRPWLDESFAMVQVIDALYKSADELESSMRSHEISRARG